MLFYDWVEFTVYPRDSGRVRSRAARLDTSRAFRINSDGTYPPEFFQAGEEGAAIIPLSTFVNSEDVFECMEIDDFGYVIVWTRNKIWFLVREGNDDRVEKLRYLPRHPPMRVLEV